MKIQRKGNDMSDLKIMKRKSKKINISLMLILQYLRKVYNAYPIAISFYNHVIH